MTNDEWGRVRSTLQKAVGQNNYTNWIEPLEFAELDGGVATFLVPTNFMGNWVERNFGDKILSQLVGAGVAVSRLEFAVPQKVSARKPANDTAPSVKSLAQKNGCCGAG